MDPEPTLQKIGFGSDSLKKTELEFDPLEDRIRIQPKGPVPQHATTKVSWMSWMRAGMSIGFH